MAFFEKDVSINVKCFIKYKYINIFATMTPEDVVPEFYEKM